MSVDPDLMSPVEDYLVFLTNSSSAPIDEDTPIASISSTITTHTLTVRESGQYRVGVAARNRAGVGEVGAYNQELGEQDSTYIHTYIIIMYSRAPL